MYYSLPPEKENPDPTRARLPTQNISPHPHTMPTTIPTNLFGLTADDSLAVLRRRYYDLALLCHPDRGGAADDMRVVQRSYEAAKAALEHQAEGDAKRAHLEAQLDMVEDEDGVKDIPSFRAIFDEVHDHFNQRFHAAFEAEAAAEGAGSTTCPAPASATDDGLFAVDPFVAQGYGDYMIVRAPGEGTLGDVPAAQLAYDASDVWADVGTAGASSTTELPTFAPPLDDAPAEAPATTDTLDGAASNSATPPVTTTLATRAHPTTTDAWARDAFPTTWTRHTRIADFGTATAVPDAVPLTDYRRSFAPLGCGKPKTWLESHLPSLREETWAEVAAEGGEASDDDDRGEAEAASVAAVPARPLPWEYQADGGGSTLTLRRRRGVCGGGDSAADAGGREGGSEWRITFESYADVEASAATSVRPRVVGGCDATGAPADASLLTHLSEQLGRLWTAWVGGDKAEDELLPAVVRFLDGVEGGGERVEKEKVE